MSGRTHACLFWRRSRDREITLRGFSAIIVGAWLTALILQLFGIGGLLGSAAYLPPRYAYRADPDSHGHRWNLGQGDLLVPFDLFVANLVLALPWPVLGAALGARSSELSPSVRDGWDRLLQVATAGLRDGDPPRPVARLTDPDGVDITADVDFSHGKLITAGDASFTVGGVTIDLSAQVAEFGSFWAVLDSDRPRRVRLRTPRGRTALRGGGGTVPGEEGASRTTLTPATVVPASSMTTPMMRPKSPRTVTSSSMDTPPCSNTSN